LLRLRREDPALGAHARGLDGAVIGSASLALRFFGSGADAPDRLLFVNLGRDLALPSIAEPLLAPPPGGRWKLLWSSEATRYGGSGTPDLDPGETWRLPGHAAVVFGASR
jgi:maltooligosyltrehalose trehalohydrolase